VTADSLNVRSGSSTDNSILGTLSGGTEVTVSELESNGWYKISYNGQSAYVSGNYLDVEDRDSVPSADASADASSDTAVSSGWTGPVLTKRAGTVQGPSGKETYYNLNMSGVVRIMRSMGNTDAYWVREDGVKMLGNYIMCAANLNVHPRGSLVESSLGTCIVCDTGSFAASNPNQLDIAVTW
jgi:uncharacterized protein YgiM (DUF1202 family)